MTGVERLERAAELMERFMRETGLTSDLPPRRYLWTDAFAVCNLLGLSEAMEDPSLLQRAVSLVDQVHHTLGRYREDDHRSGWISGLPEGEGEARPTAGGLRIGKRLPERPESGRYDPMLEWERDGQYFHYLSRWAHALDAVARRTAEEKYRSWSRELMDRAGRAFVFRTAGGAAAMFWKLSTDLSYPLVPSMGQHDPVDGLVTCLQLASTARSLEGPGSPGRSLMEQWAATYAGMVEGAPLETTDPLGVGGLLTAAATVCQLRREGLEGTDGLLPALLRAAGNGLERMAPGGSFAPGRGERLAFRELGLAIGLSGVAIMEELCPDAGDGSPGVARSGDLLAGLADRMQLGEDVVRYWSAPESRSLPGWSAHRDISSIMLATALAPKGYLELAPAG